MDCLVGDSVELVVTERFRDRVVGFNVACSAVPSAAVAIPGILMPSLRLTLLGEHLILKSCLM